MSSDSTDPLFRELGLNPNHAPTIRSSWHRCFDEYRLHPRHIARPDILTERELRDEAGTIENLIWVASPEIRRMFNRLTDGGYLVSLASANGVNVLFRCDYDLLSEMKAFGVLPGANWSERSQGTNGIGTCIKLRQSISVVSSDHYDAALRGVTCTTAPIFGPKGALECVINTTTNRATDHNTQLIMRGILERAARRIENSYVQQHYNQYRILRLAHELDFADPACEVRIIIGDDDRILDATSNLSTFLQIEREQMVGQLFATVFPSQFGPEQYLKTKALGAGPRRKTDVFALLEMPTRPSSASKRARAGSSLPDTVAKQQKRCEHIFYHHPALAPQIPKATRLINACVSLLLSGEMGTGRERFARLLYEESDHAHFHTVRCAYNPESQLASLLAEPVLQGVVYLDGIENLSANSLRQLAHRLFKPFASDGTLHDNVKSGLVVIASSDARGARQHVDLGYLHFGETLQIPPLRDYPRIDKIIDAIFCEEFRRNGMAAPQIGADALQILAGHLWTGNIAELQQVARHAAALCEDGVVTAFNLPHYMQKPSETRLGFQPTQQADAKTLVSALEHNHWNATQTAHYLGISRATLYRKIKKYRISQHNRS